MGCTVGWCEEMGWSGSWGDAAVGCKMPSQYQRVEQQLWTFHAWTWICWTGARGCNILTQFRQVEGEPTSTLLSHLITHQKNTLHFWGFSLMRWDNIHSIPLKKLSMKLFLTSEIRRSELLPASFSWLSTNFGSVTHAFSLSHYNHLQELLGERQISTVFLCLNCRQTLGNCVSTMLL